MRQKKWVKKYYNFFDKKLNSTILVAVIGAMIFTVGLSFDKKQTYSLQASVLNYNSTNQNNFQTIVIDGKKYKVIFEEL